jgi:hypothetical protein
MKLKFQSQIERNLIQVEGTTIDLDIAKLFEPRNTSTFKPSNTIRFVEKALKA